MATPRKKKAGVGAPVPTLASAVLEISRARGIEEILAVIRGRARALTGADGVTFVLREGAMVVYAEEDAIGPLWKGRRFPANACVSGLAMQQRRSIVIRDVFADPRVPLDLYRPTFVKSLALVPIRRVDPVGAIGAYWARPHEATEDELLVLETLADACGTAIENAELATALAAAVRAREDFLAVAAHELRNPLQAIVLNATVARKKKPEDARTNLDNIVRQAGHLTHLVNSLLEVSRLADNSVELVAREVDVVALLGDTLSDMPQARATTVKVKAPVSLIGWWDPPRIRRVLVNLISNALKYGESKPVTVEIVQDGTDCEIRVHDDGLGIPESDQVRIFERFSRTRDAASIEGFGLGLWIVKSLVERHGGTIGVTSSPADGTTFTVRLPLAGPPD